MAIPLNSLPSQPKDPPQFGLANVNGDDLEGVIEQIREEFVVLQEQQIAISKRIAIIKSAISGIAQIFGPGLIQGELQTLLSKPSRHRSRRHPGLTELCRRSLSESQHPLTLTEVVEQVRGRCPAALASHKNPRVSLGVVLRRLVSYSEAEEVTNSKGLRAWKWKAPTPSDAASRDNSPLH